MLPDFPELKKQLKDLVQLRIRRSVYADAAFLSEVRRYLVHEGDRSSTQRLDGSVQVKRYRRTSVNIKFQADELATLSPEQLMARVDEAASKMAERVSKRTFQELSDAIAQAGNVVQGKGRPLSVDLVFEALEAIDMDFYEDGTPHQLTMVTGSEAAKTLAKLLPEWRADPEVEQRYQALLEKKREEWRVREAGRKLVD